jgi:hypothetical protein
MSNEQIPAPGTYLSFMNNIAHAAMKAPIDNMYTHNGSLPAGTGGGVSDFFLVGFPCGAE